MHPAKNTRAPFGTSRNPPRTTCKICGCSIFEGDETAWVVSPNPGLAHQVCAEEAPPRPT
jgi:hypothetical protein